MRILLVTISARGHAIAEALKRSPQNPQIIHVCPTRNPGIRRLAEEQVIVDSLMNFPVVLEVAKRTRPDFAFIAPDDPIGGGLTDELEKLGIPSVAPKKSLARIESSKGFARELLRKYGIDASPKFGVFTTKENLKPYIERELGGNYVVKYDGLQGGKGVKVSGEHLASVEEGVKYAEECLQKASQASSDGTGRVVIEEKLVGVEFSLMSFVSGTQVIDMPPVQDHKRAYEGDTGPNTGGMGSYSDSNHLLPFLTKEDLAQASEINRRTAEALMKECGEPYRGILYGGYMVTAGGSHPERSRRVKLIEFNARFGDPEALNVLPILNTDFVAICQAIIEGSLKESLVKFDHKATVCKYIVPSGYPVNKEQKGQVVRFPDTAPPLARPSRPPRHTEVRDRSEAEIEPRSARGGTSGRRVEACLYFGDISEDADGTLRLGGSRTAGIVGVGESIEEAETIVQRLCEEVQGPVRFRSDIGSSSLIQKGVDLAHF